jgi:hypothetical protein
LRVGEIKLVCELCKEEIKDEEIIECDDMTFHEEDCFMEYIELQYVVRYERKDYLDKIKRLEEKYG